MQADIEQTESTKNSEPNIPSMPIDQRVFELILKSPNVKFDTVTADMVLKNMHMDSLETLSVAMDLEDDFKIEITDAGVEKFIRSPISSPILKGGRFRCKPSTKTLY